MTARPRCAWCNAVLDDPPPVLQGDPPLHICGPDHEAALRETLARLSKRVPLLVSGLVVTIGTMVAGGLLARPVLIPLGGMGMGLLMIVAPIATPETQETFGLKRSIALVRWSGAACILAFAALGVVLLG